ncbi:hypothetical protein C7M84_007010 [Penaeus vannamei]|uniref:Uncharacterized protein n=1 Tax=Penaeus vannamei TaxID=6689 RepID=A0A423TDC1_PENVA|nr:hypothetical protein C7M84_007010 [Penaeus vannamei]
MSLRRPSGLVPVAFRVMNPNALPLLLLLLFFRRWCGSRAVGAHLPVKCLGLNFKIIFVGRAGGRAVPLASGGRVIARYEIIMCVCDCVVRRPEDKSKPLSNKLPNGEPSAPAVVPHVAPAALPRLTCASLGGSLGIAGQPKDSPMPAPDTPRGAGRDCAGDPRPIRALDRDPVPLGLRARGRKGDFRLPGRGMSGGCLCVRRLAALNSLFRLGVAALIATPIAPEKGCSGAELSRRSRGDARSGARAASAPGAVPALLLYGFLPRSLGWDQKRLFGNMSQNTSRRKNHVRNHVLARENVSCQYITFLSSIRNSRRRPPSRRIPIALSDSFHERNTVFRHSVFLLAPLLAISLRRLSSPSSLAVSVSRCYSLVLISSRPVPLCARVYACHFASIRSYTTFSAPPSSSLT